MFWASAHYIITIASVQSEKIRNRESERELEKMARSELGQVWSCAGAPYVGGGGFIRATKRRWENGR